MDLVPELTEEDRAAIEAGVDRAPGWEGRWLKLGPASKRLGVSPKTLRKLSEEGEIDVWNPLEIGGRGQRYSAAEIDRLRQRGLKVHGLILHFGGGRLSFKGPTPDWKGHTIAQRLDACYQLLRHHGVIAGEIDEFVRVRVAYAIIRSTRKGEREGKYACLNRPTMKPHVLDGQWSKEANAAELDW